MDDVISRQALLDKFEPWLKVKDYNDGELNMLKAILYEIRFMPPATDKNVGTKLGTNLAEAGTDVPDINVGDINKFIDSLEEIFADLRERHVDDSVCGLCEYDGAYIGQSGDWCNECPGFDRADCFKLSDKCRKRWIDTITKALPSAQPELCEDAVSRNTIVQKLNKMDRYVSAELRLCDTDKKFPQNEVFIVDDVYEEIVEQLPSVQPKRGRWISADAIFGGVPFYCSECGENTRDTVMGKPRWKFCPMCGSYNGGEKDDSV